uniref:Uncharacterized protein n=1 Tax=Attheya septentrionalis TaxID=420275 RepID=A0A7S2U761_9STRA
MCCVCVMLDRINPIATWTPNCELVSYSSDTDDAEEQTPSSTSTVHVWIVPLLSMALGAVVMFVYMSRRQQEEAHNLIRQLSMPTRFEPTSTVVNERTSLFVNDKYGPT